jgi:hypothetical protein
MRDWSFRASPNKTADEQTSTAHLAAKLSATIEASPSEIGAAAINTGLPEWLLVQARGSGRYPRIQRCLRFVKQNGIEVARIDRHIIWSMGILR